MGNYITSNLYFSQVPENIILSLAQAIQNKDLGVVKSISSQYPIILKSNEDLDFTEHLLNNFDNDIIDFFLDQGVVLNNRFLHNYLFQEKSFDKISFFTSRAQNEIVDNSSKHIFYDYTHSNEITRLETDSFYKTRNYDLSWKKTLYSFAIDAAQDENSQKIVDHLIQVFPGVLDAGISYMGYLSGLLRSCPKNSPWHRDLLCSLDKRVWFDFFTSTFESESAYNVVEKLSFDNFNFLMDLLDYDQDIKTIFDKVEQNKKTQYQKWKDWFDEHLPKGADIKDTPFIKKLSRSNLDHSTDAFSSSLIDAYSNRDMFPYILRELKLDIYKYIGLVDFTSFTDKEDSSVLLFKDHPVKFTTPSFMHTFVASGSPSLSFLMRSHHYKDAILNCLDEEITLCFFSKKASIKTLCAVAKASPELARKVDECGNTIAHYKIINQPNIEENEALSLAKTERFWFEHKNNKDQNLFDLLRDKLISEETLALISSTFIKDGMMQDKTIKGKITSKSIQSNKHKI